jgi:subtilase family serine protease
MCHDKDGDMQTRRWGFLSLGAGLLVASGLVAVLAASTESAHGPSTRAALTPYPLARLVHGTPFTKPPTTAECERTDGLACYSAKQLETAYDMQPLYEKGLTGAGYTIVLVDSFGSPTIARDLATFDIDSGLPPPPSFKIIRPAGPVPSFNPHNALMVDWALETSLDVEYSHAMAPGAKLLLVETPVAETLGVHGFPQIVKAENDVIDDHLGDVISQSFATAEETFPSAASLLALRSDYVNAQTHGVTVLAAAGDWGPSSPTDATETTFFTKRVAEWPADDPLVTGVGGTQLHLDQAGDRVKPDNVWNDTALLGSPAAGSGGLSTIFSRPSYQDTVRSVVGTHRGFPDVSLSAAVNGAALVYMSFAGESPGFQLVGGTSEACPLFAGIVAIADQAAGHRLGLLNPTLYALAAEHKPGIVDITKGNNTVTFSQGGRNFTVPGWSATTGYDLASGLGTVNGAQLVAELAHG